ncbi:hypothetical protein JCM13580A_03570 [Streptomyces drozdowiczii]
MRPAENCRPHLVPPRLGRETEVGDGKSQISGPSGRVRRSGAHYGLLVKPFPSPF